MGPSWVMSPIRSSREAAVEEQRYDQLRPSLFSAHKEVEPLKYSEVAAAAAVSWQRGKACVQSTVGLLSSCLQNGESVAFVLKDVGVLLIDGFTFQMKFYYDFPEKVSGKEQFRKVVCKVSFRFLRGPGSAMTLAVPTHGPAGPGQLLGPCKCCASAVLPWAPCVLSASAVTRTSHSFPVPALQAPWLLDVVVSRVALVASRMLSGRLVVFPKRV